MTGIGVSKQQKDGSGQQPLWVSVASDEGPELREPINTHLQ